MTALQIPKKLHLIWVGDDNLKPHKCINSWKKHHPDWDVKIWDNKDLDNHQWVNINHIHSFRSLKKWAGVADLMRYEILYEHGGVYVDADSTCLRPLNNWLLENEMFASWENFLQKDRLINNAFLGSIANNDFLRFVIEEAYYKKSVTNRWSWRRMRQVKTGAWRSVGPYHLTSCAHKYQVGGYQNMTVLPSHMFSPNHFRGSAYTGGGVVYADHRWATTKKLYGLELPEAETDLNRFTSSVLGQR